MTVSADDNVDPGHFRGELDIRSFSNRAVRVGAHPAMAERDHHIDFSVFRNIATVARAASTGSVKVAGAALTL